MYSACIKSYKLKFIAEGYYFIFIASTIGITIEHLFKYISNNILFHIN